MRIFQTKADVPDPRRIRHQADVEAARWKHTHTAVVDARRIREQADSAAARRIQTQKDIPDSRRIKRQADIVDKGWIMWTKKGPVRTVHICRIMSAQEDKPDV